ncbi:hypothetical protein [Methanobrevibacter sp. DSM 116169]|uniref:hypothetical protein n=1 Tax=Methanobrevibacter sp. DSM 116169 TaxID=3242727 RepID=UPI0038FBE955
MDFINFILGIILIILIIIFIFLILGIRIIINLNKKESTIVGFINIIIFEKIAIIKKEFPEEESPPEEEKYLNKIFDKFQPLKDKIFKKEDNLEEETEEDKTPQEYYEQYKPLIPKIKKTLPYFYYFLKRIFKSFNIEKFSFHIDFGFSSYVETAKLVGYFWVFATIPNTLLKSCSLTAMPIFTKPTFDFNLDLNIKIRLINIVYALLRLIINKDVFNLIKEIIQVSRGKNEE